MSFAVADIQVRDDRVTLPEGEPMPRTAAKKEPTASALVFSRFAEGWRLCLIMHPRLGMLLPAGGHVEADETTAEAAVREVLEETGLAVRLQHVPVPLPWWILEMRVRIDDLVSAARPSGTLGSQVMGSKSARPSSPGPCLPRRRSRFPGGRGGR